MFGFMGLFGKSREIQRLENALRERGIHPRLMADAVKLTALKLLRGAPDASLDHAAELMAYCLLGDEDFAGSVGPARREAASARIDAAILAGDSLDAQLVMLALHAGAIHPGIVERFGLDLDQ